MQGGNFTVETAASLFCTAIGVPIPHISWYFNNTKLNASRKYIISVSMRPNRIRSTLFILNLSPSDEGSYKCEAKNTDGSATGTGMVSVQGKLYTYIEIVYKIILT